MIKNYKSRLNQTDIEEIINEFKLDTLATKKVAFFNNLGAELFKVETSKIKNPLYQSVKYPRETYILYLKEIKEIASFPHLVGEELNKKCLKIGEAAALAINKLWPIDSEDALLYDVLRAGPGYRLYEGFQKIGINLSKIKVRPHYKLPSYRHHNGTSGQLELIYEDFKNFDENKKITVIKPDTEASGGTSKIAIERLMEVAKQKNTKIKAIVCTGFISNPSLNVLQNLA
ncbi:MAG TPA: hypothetical protein PLR14_01520, partial [Candidatus Paceibacterota bacterium]|nr:hypothetical protein [Candidatus Paceibacterota bacterium]